MINAHARQPEPCGVHVGPSGLSAPLPCSSHQPAREQQQIVQGDQRYGSGKPCIIRGQDKAFAVLDVRCAGQVQDNPVGTGVRYSC